MPRTRESFLPTRFCEGERIPPHDGAQVVSSQYGEPYAEDGFSLQDELNREVISFSCEHEGKIVIYLKGDR